MGPFKFLSLIFGSSAKAITASLGAIETTANVVNLWADTAHQASEVASVQLIDEMKFENSLRNEELKARMAKHTAGEAS